MFPLLALPRPRSTPDAARPDPAYFHPVARHPAGEEHVRTFPDICRPVESFEVARCFSLSSPSCPPKLSVVLWSSTAFGWVSVRPVPSVTVRSFVRAYLNQCGILSNRFVVRRPALSSPSAVVVVVVYFYSVDNFVVFRCATSRSRRTCTPQAYRPSFRQLLDPVLHFRASPSLH